MRTHTRVRFISACLAVALAVAACSRNARYYLDRGDALLREGKVDAAVLEYRNAVQQDPMLAQAHVKLADAYLKQKNGAAALGEYVRAADLLPKDVDAQLKAGSLLLLARKAEEAKSRAEKALAIDPKNVNALVLRANAMAGLNELDGALEQMEQALQLDRRSGIQANLGAIQAASGKLPEAEASFRQAVVTDPKSLVARLALGQFLWATGKPAEAESEFRAALATDGANIAANRTLALFCLLSNRAIEAEPYFRKAAESAGDPAATNPADAAAAAAARVALADYYVAMKRPADAIAVLDKLSAAPRFWALAKSKTADIQYTNGKKVEAFATVDEVVRKQPRLAAARVVRGRLLLADGRVDEALSDAQEAAKGDPQSAEAQYLLGTACQAKADLDGAAKAFTEVLRLNPKAAAAQVQLARIALQRNAIPSAVQLAEQAANLQPGNLAAQLVLARSLLARGDLDRAASITRALVEAAPQLGMVQTQAGMLALAKGDKAGARVAFEKALALDDRLVEALSALVSLDLQDKAPQRARARIEQRLQKAPTSGALSSALLALAGRTWASTGDLAKGEEFLRRAIEADPSNLEAYSDLGGLYFAQKKLDQAVAEFDRLAARQPSAVGPPTMAGLILQAQGKEAEARQRYERLVEKDSHAAVASNNLAWMYASRGEQLDRALQLAQAAVAELPEHPDFNDTLAFVYLKKQLPSLAIPPLRLAIEKGPGNPSFHYHLGLAYSQTGDKLAARQSLERALKLKPDFDGAEDARKVLRTLE